MISVVPASSPFAIVIQDDGADGSLERLLQCLSNQMTQVDCVAEAVVVTGHAGKSGGPDLPSPASLPGLRLSLRSGEIEEPYEQAVWNAASLVGAPYAWTLSASDRPLEDAVSKALDLIQERPDVDVFVFNLFCEAQGADTRAFIPDERVRGLERVMPLATVGNAVGWMGLISNPSATLCRTSTFRSIVPALEPESLSLLSRSNRFLAAGETAAMFVATPIVSTPERQQETEEGACAQLALQFAVEASRLAIAYRLDPGAAIEVGPRNFGLLGDLIVTAAARYLAAAIRAETSPSNNTRAEFEVADFFFIEDALKRSSAMSHRSIVKVLARAWVVCERVNAVEASDVHAGNLRSPGFRVKDHAQRLARAQVDSDLRHIERRVRNVELATDVSE